MWLQELIALTNIFASTKRRKDIGYEEFKICD